MAMTKTLFLGTITIPNAPVSNGNESALQNFNWAQEVTNKPVIQMWGTLSAPLPGGCIIRARGSVFYGAGFADCPVSATMTMPLNSNPFSAQAVGTTGSVSNGIALGTWPDGKTRTPMTADQQGLQLTMANLSGAPQTPSAITISVYGTVLA